MRIPTCSHIFHPACLKEWLLSNYKNSEQKCPFCNHVLKVDELQKALNERECLELSERMLFGQDITRNKAKINVETGLPISVGPE